MGLVRPPVNLEDLHEMDILLLKALLGSAWTVSRHLGEVAATTEDRWGRSAISYRNGQWVAETWHYDHEGDEHLFARTQHVWLFCALEEFSTRLDRIYDLLRTVKSLPTKLPSWAR